MKLREMNLHLRTDVKNIKRKYSGAINLKPPFALISFLYNNGHSFRSSTILTLSH